MFRTGTIRIFIIISIVIGSCESSCISEKLYGFLNNTLFPVTLCGNSVMILDSIIRIVNEDKYQIYLDRVV